MAYETHAIREQILRTTNPEDAAERHRFALLVLRARLAEEDDPIPQGPVVDCLRCAAIYAAGGS